MSQEKAQLIAPIGIMTVSGVTATGVITATSFSGNVVGSAKSLVNGTDVTTGVITATSFVGNLTGNILRLADSAPDINVGASTATSFVGNLTGSVTDLTDAPDITVGVVTATTFEGPVTGNVTGNATGLAGGLGVNYNGGWTGAGTSQINAGVVTATTFYGDGSNLDGVSSGPVSQQSIGITSANTTIDLSNGNLIYATQSANTTVSFANTANGNVYFIRTKDDTSTARTITWPTGIGWSGGSAPTLLNNPRSTDAQIFLLVTRDMGLNWYGKEVVRMDPQTFDLFAWGNNLYGTLGQNDRTSRSSPIQVGTDNTWSKIKGFCGNNYAIKTNGTLWSWGYGGTGSLAQNDRTQYSSPTQVGTDTTWGPFPTGEAGQRQWAACQKTDGTLWSWGYNAYGALGLNQKGAPGRFSSPVQVPGTWDKVDATPNHTFAIKTDGSLWTWGANYRGQLGKNNPDNNMRSSPVQVGTDTTWSKVAGGYNNCGAIKTDNTLWVWGTNQTGSLGLNQQNPFNTSRSSPTQLPGTWSNGKLFFPNCATFIKTDGTLWSWGYNQYGALGLNNKTNYSSPVQVGTDTTWNIIYSGTGTSVASKTDGTFWVWGYNDNAQLGLNNTGTANSLSSPTQLTGEWGSIATNESVTMGLKKG